MIEDFGSLYCLVNTIFPSALKCTRKEKQRRTKAVNAILRNLRFSVPMTEKAFYEILCDKERVTRFHGIGKSTAEYITGNAKEALDSLTLEERISIDDED